MEDDVVLDDRRVEVLPDAAGNENLLARTRRRTPAFRVMHEVMPAPNSVVERRALVCILPPSFRQWSAQDVLAIIPAPLPLGLHPLLNPLPRGVVVLGLFFGPIPEADDPTGRTLLGTGFQVIPVEVTENDFRILLVVAEHALGLFVSENEAHAEHDGADEGAVLTRLQPLGTPFLAVGQIR